MLRFWDSSASDPFNPYSFTGRLCETGHSFCYARARRRPVATAGRIRLSTERALGLNYPYASTLRTTRVALIHPRVSVR